MIATPESIGSETRGRTKDQLLEQVSASRLTTFHQCRLKFYFKYVLGLPSRRTPALHVGTTVHAVLQEWNKARWRKKAFTADQAREVFAKAWTEDQHDDPIAWEDGYEADEMKTGWNLLERYFEQSPIPKDEPAEGVEVTVEADLSSKGLTKLVGIIDLVRPGGRIVDFKTAGQTPSAEKVGHLHETQMACYCLLYRDATGSQEGGLELHHLVKLKTPKIIVTALDPMTSSQESRVFRVMESYLEGVSREDWVPNPNAMSCSCCEYFNQCRNWHG